jgi:ribosomal protein S8
LNLDSKNIVKMAQDIISDGLNQIMNAKRAGKRELEIRRVSKVLIGVLELMKKDGHIEYSLEGDEKKPVVKIKIIKLNECRAIKPRYFVQVEEIDRYLRRFLPSRKIGELAITTNVGIVTHKVAYEKNVGGSLIAYFY